MDFARITDHGFSLLHAAHATATDSDGRSYTAESLTIRISERLVGFSPRESAVFRISDSADGDASMFVWEFGLGDRSEKDEIKARRPERLSIFYIFEVPANTRLEEFSLRGRRLAVAPDGKPSVQIPSGEPKQGPLSIKGLPSRSSDEQESDLLARTRAFLERGGEADSRGQWGRTRLHNAADMGYERVGELLISEGADPNAKDVQRQTPLHLATFRGNSAVAELLIGNGADVGAKDALGLTPLHRAASQGYERVIGCLIAAGADVGARDNSGATPLHLAVGQMLTATTEFLIAKGADVNAKDHNGVTPLHLAVDKAHIAMAELLLARGASVTAKDHNGVTPLDMAVRQHDTSMEHLLGKHDGKTSPRPRQPRTPEREP